MSQANTPPASRRRLQLGLSSTIAIQFVAALLVFANAIPTQSSETIRMHNSTYAKRGYGWPAHFYVTEEVNIHSKIAFPTANISVGESVLNSVFDVIVALMILLTCAALLGRTPRWRKMRRR